MPQASRRRVPRPLLVILAVQAGLSLLLAVSNTAFGDEALYLWAGHIELAHWFQGAHVAVSPFKGYFSGAPQFYPPIAALADSAGGLLGARILSLAFMLATTCLLWSAAHRISGTRAAVISCALWLACEPCLRMGAYATYDPMAIFLVCLALWAVIRAAGGSRYYRELAALAALALALGCVAAYSYAIYIPVVLGVGIIAWALGHSRRRAVILAVWMSVCLAVLLAAIPSLLGLWPGISHTVLNRQITRDHQSIPSILQTAWSDVGPLVVIATAGALLAIAVAVHRGERFLRAALLVAAFCVPAYQILIARTGWALDKHLAAGMWCVILAAGAGFATVTLPGLKVPARAAVVLVALSLPLYAGWYSAYGIMRSWQGTGRLVAAMRPLTATAHGDADTNLTPSLLDYYSWPASLHQLKWQSSISLDPPRQRGSLTAWYTRQLAAKRPGLVVLYFPAFLKGEALPADVLGVMRSDKGERAAVGRLAGASTQGRGLYSFALALEENPSYRLAGTGPSNEGFGSYSATPGTFVIWQRLARS